MELGFRVASIRDDYPWVYRVDRVEYRSQSKMKIVSVFLANVFFY